MYPSRVRREYSLHTGWGWAENPFCLHIWDIILRRKWLNTSRNSLHRRWLELTVQAWPLVHVSSLTLKKNKTKDTVSFHWTISYRNTCLEKVSHFLSLYQAYKRKKNKPKHKTTKQQQQQQVSIRKETTKEVVKMLKSFLMWRDGHCSAFKYT